MVLDGTATAQHASAISKHQRSHFYLSEARGQMGIRRNVYVYKVIELSRSWLALRVLIYDR
jgi:hypothetical protein